jgi:hypothetical protein
MLRIVIGRRATETSAWANAAVLRAQAHQPLGVV